MAQEPSGDDGSSDSAMIDINVDVANADASAVAATLDDLQANVQSQLDALTAAEAAVTAAQAEVDTAKATVAETETEIDGLIAQSDAVVVESYMSAPSEEALDTLAAETAEDATMKQELLNMRADSDADVLADLDDAQNRLEDEKKVEEEAAEAAKDRKAEADLALEDLDAALSQQAQFLSEVYDRIERQLAEAAALESLDPAAAARQNEIATKLSEIANSRAYQRAQEALAEAERQRQEEAARQPIELGAPSGSLAEVACPGGGAITVDSSLRDPLTSLQSAASADGVNLCGGGFRDPQEQVQLRSQNCGTSDYAIYEAPASSCSPPTARPGTSMHEQGLAIDFTSGGSTLSCGGGGYEWLKANAATYGLYNLPGECWHWSTTGQ